MAFILRWKNPNKLATTINIYRDTKSLVAGSLPAPIATLTAGETQWRDTTAVKGQTYYYLLSVTANGKTVYGAQQTYKIEVKRGIGPQTYIWGNDELGYLGPVPYVEQFDQNITPTAFQALISTPFTDRIPLQKFSYQGRIMYIIDRTAGYINNVTWGQVYTGGLIYGRDDNGPDGCWGDMQPVKQDASVFHNNDQYRIRVPRGLVDLNGDLMFPFDTKLDRVNHDKVVPALGINEYNDLLLTQQQYFPANRRSLTNRPNSYTYFGQATVTNGALLNAGVMCQERDTLTKKALARGLFYSNGNEGPVDVIQKINYVLPTQICRYIPIIELVE